MLSRDINQHRLNLVLPVPNGTVQLEQTFTPTSDGLATVELMLARRTEPVAGEAGRLTLQLHDATGVLIAQRALETGRYQHNQTFLFRFAPQPHSAGQQYTLTLSGNESNLLTVWGYELDSLDDGALRVRGVASDAADLRLLTHSQLTTGLALRTVGRLLVTSLPIFLNFLLVALLPGLLILRLLPLTSRWDPAVYWTVAIALGMAVWPLLWLWPSLLGWRWGVWTARFMVVGGWALYLALPRHRVSANVVQPERPLGETRCLRAAPRCLRAPPALEPLAPSLARHPGHRARQPPACHPRPGVPALGRFQPPWSNRRATAPDWPLSDQLPTHAARRSGRLPLRLPHLTCRDGAVLVPSATHTVLLYLGQYLNALVPLMAYSGLWLLTRNRAAGLIAAFLIALPFFFPAYYVTWGRLTQLSGMLLMPLLLAFTWQLLRGPRGHRRPLYHDPRIWLISFLATGLLLIHVRVFLLYLPFAGLIWLVSGGRNGRRLLTAGLLACLLSLPQLIRLASFLRPSILLAPVPAGHNDFPTSYLTIGWETPLLYITAGLLALALLASRRRRRHLALPVLLLAWVGLLALSLAGKRIGLPESWLVSLNSGYITLFLPQAWLLALSVRLLARALRHSHWIAHGLAYAGLGLCLAQAAFFGWQQQITLLNETTLLAQPADEAGLSWVRANLPMEATIAHGSWDWLNGVWAGSDGGAWLLPVTGRFSTTPPIDHYYNRVLRKQVQEFNRQAQAVQDWSDPAAIAWLQRQDVSYIYVGARGGYFEPLALAQNPQTELLYAHNGVFVFALK